MDEQLDYYKDVARGFLTQYLDDLVLRARFMGIEPVTLPEDVLQTETGRQVMMIAQAADGTDLDGLERTEVYDCVQGMLERLFAIPNQADYVVPQSFWEGEFGAMVALALVWASGDELITVTQAAEISGKSASALSQLVDRGRLHAYPDMSEPNPQRRNRLLRSEVEALDKPQ